MPRSHEVGSLFACFCDRIMGQPTSLVKPSSTYMPSPHPPPVPHQTPAATHRLYTPWGFMPLPQVPTRLPTTTPSEVPTRGPTVTPSQAPTRDPSTAPSRRPTTDPTTAPSRTPSDTPTRVREDVDIILFRLCHRGLSQMPARSLKNTEDLEVYDVVTPRFAYMITTRFP
jgi:hypothetical protein